MAVEIARLVRGRPVILVLIEVWSAFPVLHNFVKLKFFLNVLCIFRLQSVNNPLSYSEARARLHAMGERFAAQAAGISPARY